jgi:hypothetical protein
MKRVFVFLVLVVSFLCEADAQLINAAKPLPAKSFGVTLAPVFNVDNVFHYELEGMSYLVMAGYGLRYDLDVNLKYGYYNGPDFFSADVQYLFRETRKSYYSLVGGVHKWKEYGVDLAVNFTYTPQYRVNLTFGLDMDLDISEVELRGWIPINFGLNFDDRYIFYLEYDLPVTERSWDMLGGGVTFIFR